LRLLVQRGEDPWVPVALVQRRVSAEHVEVAPALHIPDPDTLAALQHDRQGLVVVRAPALRLREREPGPPLRRRLGARLRGALRRLPRRCGSTHHVAAHHSVHSPWPGSSGTPHSGHWVARYRTHSTTSSSSGRSAAVSASTEWYTTPQRSAMISALRPRGTFRRRNAAPSTSARTGNGTPSTRPTSDVASSSDDATIASGRPAQSSMPSAARASRSSSAVASPSGQRITTTG